MLIRLTGHSAWFVRFAFVQHHEISVSFDFKGLFYDTRQASWPGRDCFQNKLSFCNAAGSGTEHALQLSFFIQREASRALIGALTSDPSLHRW